MGPDLMEAPELYERMAQGNVRVIDTRDPAVFARGRLRGAVNIRDIFLYLCTEEQGGIDRLRAHFAALFGEAGIDRDDEVVLTEDAMDNGYGQACRGWLIFRLLGHRNVSVLHGGLLNWRKLGHPLYTDTPRYHRRTYVPEPDDSFLARKQDVLAALGDPDIALVDVRDYAEWIAANASPYGMDFCPRMGRIPGAQWLEWYRFMTIQGGVSWFRPPEEIRQLAAETGLLDKKEIIVYCFKGARTSNVLMALRRAGIHNVRNYFASWNEWSRDPALPCEEGYPDR